MEGTDSAERAADNAEKSFENQIAVFALAVANIVLVNLPNSNIGTNTAGCRRLLQTISQAASA
ncbi:unnamed protein product, partial [Sphagnum compactum]